jgi:CBS domain containing-hemolysin-like protein
VNPAIWIALIACLGACYFSACNIALKSFSRKRLADLLEARGRVSRLGPFLERVNETTLMAGTLRTILVLVVLLATFSYLEGRLGQQSRVLVYGVSFLVAGILVSIFAVAIPVSWARYRRESLLAWSIPLLTVVLIVLMPLIKVLHLFDPIVRRISGVDLAPREDTELSEEVLSVVEGSDSGSEVDEAQKEMLEAVFDLPSTTAGEIMTPRTDVVGIDVSATPEEVKQTIMRFGHSRIPVYDQSLDNIVGILYAKDLIQFVGDGNDFDLRSVLREAFLVPESKSVRELLAEFKARKVHIAMVLDEYGGTAGLVTIEDIIEEIVGDIQDEYELKEEGPYVHRLDERTIEVDARMRIDDLNDEIDLQIPEGEDYDTVGGFVICTLGHIPATGEWFEQGVFRLTVTGAERTKVTRVRVERLESQAATAGPSGR